MSFDVFDSKFAQNIYLQKYSMNQQETWCETAKRVVTAVCGQLLSLQDQQELVEMISNREFIPGGRYLYSAGRAFHQVNNCFLFRAEDSREAWADLMYKGTSALMTGGGIGADYSNIRPKGAPIKRTGGTCTGPIALMNMVNESGRYIMQGGQRRSAIWAGLSWSHGDIFEFMKIKDYSPELKAAKEKDFNFPLPMEGTNISVIYDTAGLMALHDVDHKDHDKATNIWLENCKQSFMSAEPGMAFNYCKDNESLRNAPVVAATKVLTNEGYQKVGDIIGRIVRVWTGEQWAETTFKKTKEKADLVNVELSNGRSIICDPEHPFIVKNYLGAGKSKKTEFVRIPAAELCVDQKIRSDLPAITALYHKASYGLGYVYGDGSIRQGKGDISFHDDSKEKAFRRAVDSLGAVHHGLDNRAYFSSPYDDKSVLLNDLDPEFIAGWFDADGCYTRNLLRLSCVDRYALETLQDYLDLLGIKTTVREDGATGFGTNRPMYTLQILSDSLVQFKNRIPTERIQIDLPDNWKPYRESEIRVVNVTSLEYKEDVYCCDVGVAEHSFMAEGVVISNCTEVTSEDDSDKCNLGTLWLHNIKDRKRLKRVTHLATKFLLCGGIYSDVPTEKIKEVGLENNRIGLGLGGIHDWLMIRGMPYSVTPELHKWLKTWVAESDAAAHIYSKELGVKKPRGIRSIAPTGTIGILAEATTGIEPLFCKAYKRRYLKGQEWVHEYVVPGTVKRLLDKGVKVEHITDAYDISFKDRVKFQADIQDYVDMAISSTCNLPSWGSPENCEETVEENAATLLKYAKRLRGFTCYPDGSRGGQPLTRVSIEEAMEKEGVIFEDREHECLNGVCGV